MQESAIVPEEISNEMLSRLSEFVTARMGLHFPQERWSDLVRNIKPAAAQLGFKTVEECVQWLLSSSLTQQQLEVLASHLTVGETYFFREPKVLEIVQDQILAQLVQARQTERRLRIWSAGCASGEEPYSIAIALTRAIPDWKNWNITLLATDINPKFLRKASEGVYNDWSFRDASLSLKENYFIKRNHRRYEILPQFKQMVHFAYLNLAEDSFPSLLNNTNAMDLIFCRNVLMYFSPEQANKVIAQFYEALVDGGWFIVSATETLQVSSSRFTRVGLSGLTLYNKDVHHKAKEQFAAREELPTNQLLPEMKWAPLPGGGPEVPAKKTNKTGSPEEEKEPRTTFEEALALYEVGRYFEAEEKLLTLASNRVPEAKVAALLARIFANEGKLDDALNWCDKAVAADKMDPELHHLRATILQEQNNLEGAVAALKRALYLDPNFVLPHFALGNLALRRENSGEADRHFRNALSLLERLPQENILPGSEGVTAGRLREIISRTILQETAT
jgi:chemotaxis protein methyltransferase CheR